MRPIGIDLFAGAGGLSLGFEQAGFDVAAAVEIDPVHAAVHEYNFPRCRTMCADVAALTGKAIRRSAGLGAADIDVVFGGAPCQGFSMIGKRALDDPRNRLVREFARLVFELKPKYFVFENVKGLTLGTARTLLQELIQDFERLGYSVKQPYQVLNAAHFGVPQDRQRLFLIGRRKGQREPAYPLPTTRPSTKKIPVSMSELPTGPTVWDAIGDLPQVEDYPQLLTSDCAEVTFGTPSAYAMRLRGATVGDGDHSYRRKWDEGILTSSLRTEHTRESRKRFKATKHGKVEPVSRFHKLDPNGISNTLRAGTGSDKGAYTSPRPIHPYQPRCITVREAARLHSYPDWFRFHATKWHGCRQIGNSVPPLLGRAVAAQIVHALDVQIEKPKALLKLGDAALVRFTMAEAAAHFDVPADVVGRRRRLAVNE